MRITNGMLTARFLSDLHARMESMEKSQGELTSGTTIRRPSDNPVGATRAMSLKETIARNDQYMRNVDSANSFLGATESNMRSIVDLLQRANELAVAGANGTLNEQDLHAIGQEAEQLLNQAVQVGNSKYQNYYVFGGTNLSTPPYTLVTGASMSVTPPNSPGAVTREIGAGQSMQINVPGDTVLPAAMDALAALRNAGLSGDNGAVQATIGTIQGALETMMGGLAGVGAKMNRLEATQQRYDAVQVNFKSLLSQVQDTDIADAISTLQLQQTSYQAALQTGGKILQPSLLDFLR